MKYYNGPLKWQTDKIIEKEFDKFLKQNNIYKRYWYNYKNFPKSTLIHNETDPFGKIIDGFVWTNTEEGYDFWSDINSVWRDKLREEYTENTKKSKLLKL